MTFFWLDPEAVVYRCYSVDDELLYVGCTTRLRNRIWQHQSRTPWWPEVARIDLEPPVGHGLAAVLERYQIIHLAPLHNKVANYKRGWDYARNGQRGGGGLVYFPEKDQFTDHDQVAA